MHLTLTHTFGVFFCDAGSPGRLYCIGVPQDSVLTSWVERMERASSSLSSLPEALQTFVESSGKETVWCLWVSRTVTIVLKIRGLFFIRSRHTAWTLLSLLALLMHRWMESTSAVPLMNRQRQRWRTPDKLLPSWHSIDQKVSRSYGWQMSLSIILRAY